MEIRHAMNGGYETMNFLSGHFVVVCEFTT